MKRIKRVIPIVMAAMLTTVSVPLVARADSSKVVTLGANLSEDQKASMYKYFGTFSDKVETITVTNEDERKYMEGIATEAQIGTRTYSCSYVEPTTSGGIQVKVANLTFATSSMIASTLLTSGMENCNVIAASPIEVSGTGALTGIMMAYETASGEELDEGQKQAATEELVTTGEIADSVGTEEAADLMTDVKEEVIGEGLKEEGDIESAVDDAADDTGVQLSDAQKQKIVSLMKNISQYDYNADALEKTMDNLEGKSDGFFSNLWNKITGFFGGGDSDGGILNGTDDSALGADAIIDSTLDSVSKKGDDGESLWDKITGFFKGIFGGDDAEDKKDDTADTEAADTDAADSSDADDSTDDNADENTLDNAEVEETDINTDNTDDADNTDNADDADAENAADSNSEDTAQ